MITKLRKTFYLLILIAAFMSAGMGPGKNTGEVQKKRLVWPPPPDESRIEYIQSITTPDDIGISRGFFKRVWEFITGEERMDRTVAPYGVATDNSGRLYVTDTALRAVHVFDQKKGKYKRLEGDKSTRFEWPIGVASDKEGNIYVTDSVLNRVFVFSDDGKYLRDIGKKGAFMRPTGIAVDRDAGLLYIMDTIAHCVHVYTAGGQHKFSLGKNGEAAGEFNFPTAIAVGKDGNFYVLDSMNLRVQIFDRAGRFLYKFGALGDTTGNFARPRSITLDMDGNIYVVDALFNAVQIFDKKGRLLLVFGRGGDRAGEFTLPAGIYIDGADNKIYVADSYNSRVQVFRYISNNGSQPLVNSSHQRK